MCPVEHLAHDTLVAVAFFPFNGNVLAEHPAGHVLLRSAAESLLELGRVDAYKANFVLLSITRLPIPKT
jgi:hypothetical protein